MLKLKNVSKFYYNRGVVASGFNKINLELNIGEFVVITGESGSGKSTLLNVISGLDSYEEGEMYINGEETSYYSESDFEDYRKKYIANIFQNFNLVNSYTVYQNLELIYILNNMNDKNMKEKIEDLLNQVGLIEYKNTKVSKLSGGQKQRVAIARALAKDTPIIVADEPTGNLDSKSAKEIVKLLYEISKNKLVVIVTHNYDQVEKYATRKIRMHDGKILEDTVIEKAKKVKYEEKEYGYPTLKDKFRLAFRNAFNIVPKFLLLLLVFLLLSLAVIGEYTSNLKSNYDLSLFGFNQFFKNTDDSRIIIKKKDKTPFSDDELNKLKELNNVDRLVKNDSLLDSILGLSDNENDLYFYGTIHDISMFDGKLDEGVMPKEDNEVIVLGYKYMYNLSDFEKIQSSEFDLNNNYGDTKMVPYKLKIVGIKYMDENSLTTSLDPRIYVDSKVLDDASRSINSIYSSIDITINKTKYKSTNGYNQYNIYPSDMVSKGKALIPDELSYICNYSYCPNNKVKVEISNLYYSDELNLTVSRTYVKSNFERLTGLKDYDRYSSNIFINDEEYYNLFDKEPYQVSVFIKDVKKLDESIKLLEENGYTALHVKDALVDFSEEIRVFTNLIKVIGIIIALVALFFISYFVIKIILKSRNIYFSTVRILGASKKDVKTLINVELNIILDIAYLLIILVGILVTNNIIKWNYLKDLVSYLNLWDYIVLYIVLFIMSYLISSRFAKSLYKKSAMKTYREV